ncbi:MAG TPA: DNA gyrase inhibitor YacG [Vicinamibacterales bacterium]|nr:DNA gyrase inhibitor YacG [Vicinamibacterales bacterium]
MPEARLCVSCRQRPAEPSWRPFCSERCRTIDLGRWLSGRYRVPGETTGEPAAGEPDTDEEPPPGRPIDR